MQSTRPPVYVASPLGFTESGRLYNEQVLLPMIRESGYEPLDPWDVDPDVQRIFGLPAGHPERAAGLERVNRLVGQRNADMIRQAVALLAILDGNDVDSGTAAEIGYAAALQKPVIGVRSDLRTTGDNEATLVNLQVEWFIIESGGRLTTQLDEALQLLQVVTAS